MPRSSSWRDGLRLTLSPMPASAYSTPPRPEMYVDEDAADLAPSDHHVIRPLDAAPHAGQSVDSFAGGQRRHHGEGARVPRLRSHDDCDVDVSRGRSPAPTPSALTAGLLVGDDNHAVRGAALRFFARQVHRRGYGRAIEDASADGFRPKQPLKKGKRECWIHSVTCFSGQARGPAPTS